MKYVDPTRMYWETLFDIASLALSVYDYQNDPSVLNGIFVGVDSACVGLPIPAVAGYVKNAPRAAKVINYFNGIANRANVTSSIVDTMQLWVQNIRFKFTQRAWSKGNAGNDVASLVGHFVAHGSELGAKTVDEYYQMANKYIDEGKYIKMDDLNKNNGDILYWDEAGEKLLVTDKDGVVRSFYKTTAEKAKQLQANYKKYMEKVYEDMGTSWKNMNQ